LETQSTKEGGRVISW